MHKRAITISCITLPSCLFQIPWLGAIHCHSGSMSLGCSESPTYQRNRRIYNLPCACSSWDSASPVLVGMADLPHSSCHVARIPRHAPQYVLGDAIHTTLSLKSNVLFSLAWQVWEVAFTKVQTKCARTCTYIHSTLGCPIVVRHHSSGSTGAVYITVRMRMNSSTLAGDNWRDKGAQYTSFHPTHKL